MIGSGINDGSGLVALVPSSSRETLFSELRFVSVEWFSQWSLFFVDFWVSLVKVRVDGLSVSSFSDLKGALFSGPWVWSGTVGVLCSLVSRIVWFGGASPFFLGDKCSVLG